MPEVLAEGDVITVRDVAFRRWFPGTVFEYVGQDDELMPHLRIVSLPAEPIPDES